MKSYDKIRQLREKHKWSQEDMANQLGLSPNGYAKIERGETRLTIPRLEQIAEVFGIDILELIQTEVQHLDYQIGNNHINHSSDFTIYGKADAENLAQEIEKLKLIIQHQNELLQLKETLLMQQSRELEIAQKLLAEYEK